MFERFTVAARDVVIRAREEAARLRHPFVGTEHLLLALLSDDAGLAYTVLHQSGVDAERVRADMTRLVGTPADVLGEEDAAALQTIGIDLNAVLATIEDTFGPDALGPPQPPQRRGAPWRRQVGGSPRFAARSKKVLELSLREAIRLRHHHIGTEHLLLGLIREGSGLAAKILTDAGIRLDDLRRSTLARLDEAA